ncbi:MmgE/PrpD family protein [Marinomonas aquimarina]|uniref:MmgE/PrpD family protein n=1 Tax=Marinomonas aquimarina TaxID=295068 RepID=A0A1A8TGC6_9GAMM|nr:MmgE/PrpD family protein [Marinomonas aquimarina]SBS32195.1 MmgE/PrpD family protein [Marinomonas aquimarina]
MSKVFGFNSSLKYSEIPDQTKGLITSSLLDILGIIAAATKNNTYENIRSFATQHYSANQTSARLLFDGRSVSPLGAAWAGGFAADSLDGHEGHFLSKGHAGATVVPGLLALVDAHCEQGRDITGEEFLTLLTIAYETSLRAGVSLMQSASDYHASGAFSGIGLVAAGARLLDLPQEVQQHALGIAEYFAPRCPMMRLVDYPSNLRDAHGAGAFTGINALLIAQSGITGAPAELLLSDTLSPAWQSLGQEWEIDNQYYKPWPVCRWAQPALTAVEAMLELDSDICAANIESIRIETFHESMRLQGHQPKNADEAQYALAFPVAAMLCYGTLGPEQVSDAEVHDEAILALSQLVEIVESQELSQRFPAEILSVVEILLKDGRRVRSPITQAKGDPAVPMRKADIHHKFLHYTTGILSSDQQYALIEEVESLASQPSLARLLSMVTMKP